MEKRIRDLCSLLSKAKSKEELETIGEQLRSAIQEYIESMRQRIETGVGNGSSGES